MTLFANYAMSRYAAIEYGVRGPENYSASTSDAVTGSDGKSVVAAYVQSYAESTTATDGAIFYIFEPIAIFLLEQEHRAEELRAEIREIETDERAAFPVPLNNRREILHAHMPAQVSAENRRAETDEKRSNEINMENRQSQAKEDRRNISIKSNSRNFTTLLP